MKVFLRILFLDGTDKQIVCGAAEIVAWESRFDKSVATLTKGFRATDLLFMAWHFEKRTNATDLDFETWLPLVDLVELGDSDPK